MPCWLKNILIKLKLYKAEEPAEVPRVIVRDIDLDEFNRRSVLLRKLTDEQHIAVQKKHDDTAKCPSCGEHTDKIITCAKCGKEICEGCGTYCSAVTGVDGGESAPEGYYCEDCW